MGLLTTNNDVLLRDQQINKSVSTVGMISGCGCDDVPPVQPGWQFNQAQSLWQPAPHILLGPVPTTSQLQQDHR